LGVRQLRGAAALNPWFDLCVDAMQLGLEAQTVIGLRIMKAAAGGPGAQAEAELMVTEKIQATVELQAQLMAGGLTAAPHETGARAVAMYRKKVQANRRRLLAGR
jgi:hypothetical protein